MGDSYTNNQTDGRDFQNHRDSVRNNFRGGRGPSNREGGGFRIRLSDNEMRAARALQEAFNLRSTVAVLGFALRTLAQMLEDGSLETFLKEYRSQNPNNSQRRTQGELNSNKGKDYKTESKPNPFARPEKPSKEKVSLSSEEEIEPLSELDQDQQIEKDTLQEADSTNSGELG